MRLSSRSCMSDKLIPYAARATLKCCAEFAGSEGNLDGFYKWAASRLTHGLGEPWGPARVEYWLRRECWGRWVESGTVRLTLAGRVELRALDGELCGEELEIWRDAA